MNALNQILLEPAVIQDVLSAGSHLQLLELLSLCSHYLIQVRAQSTDAHAHMNARMHTCTQTFTCSGVLVCELGTADIRKRNQRRNRFMLQIPHQVNENLVITLMCERYGPLRNSCSIWSYLPVISGEFLQMSHLTWGWIAYIGHFTHFLNHYPNCQVSPVFLSSFL